MRWQYTLVATLLCLLGASLYLSLRWPPGAVVLCTLLAELLLSIRMVREDERLVPIFLSRIFRARGVNLSAREKEPDNDPLVGERRVFPGLFGTGALILPWPFFRIRRYPTGIQEQEITMGARRRENTTEFFEGDDVLTKPGYEDVPDPSNPKKSIQRAVARARVGARVKLLYQWNMRRLHDAVMNAPPPDSEALKTLFQDTVDADFRRAVADTTLPKLYSARKAFEQKVRNFAREKESIFFKIGLVTDDKDEKKDPHLFDLAVREVIVVEEHRKAMDEEQAAVLRAGATRHTAEAEKFKAQRLAEASAYKIEQDGTAVAKARGLLFAAIRGTKEDAQTNVTLEALLRLSELGQGTANTVLYQLPPGMVARLGQAFGGEGGATELVSLLFQGITPEQRQQLLSQVIGVTKQSSQSTP